MEDAHSFQARYQRQFLGLVGLWIVALLVLTTAAVFSLYHDTVKGNFSDLQAAAKDLTKQIQRTHNRRVAAFQANTNAALSVVPPLSGDDIYFPTVFRETGEFQVVKRVDDQIVFLGSTRHDPATPLEPIPLNSPRAAPVQRALTEARGGTLTGLDYRGVRVIAAYEPLPSLGLGVVAKMDLHEIRRPFIVTLTASSSVSIALILLGAGYIRRIHQHVVRDLISINDSLQRALVERMEVQRSLARNAHDMQTALDSINHAILIFSEQGDRLIFVNQQARTLLNIPPIAAASEPTARSSQWAPTEVLAGLREAIRKGQKHLAQAGISRTDGSVFPALLFFCPIRLFDQPALLCTLSDTSDYSRMEIQREKEIMLRHLHDGISGLLVNIGLLTDMARSAASYPVRDVGPQGTLSAHVPSQRDSRPVRDVGPDQEIGDSRPASLSELLGHIAQLARQGSSEIRSLMNLLDREQLTGQELAAELEHYAHTMLDGHHVAFALTLAGDRREDRLRTSTCIPVLSIFKEAINNVVKHAQAQTVSVRLSLQSPTLEMTVLDDGQGLPSAPAPGRGFTHMQRWADSLGGRVAIANATPAGGVRIQLAAPLQPAGFSPVTSNGRDS